MQRRLLETTIVGTTAIPGLFRTETTIPAPPTTALASLTSLTTIPTKVFHVF
jgi:hypothetical protein